MPSGQQIFGEPVVKAQYASRDGASPNRLRRRRRAMNGGVRLLLVGQIVLMGLAMVVNGTDYIGRRIVITNEQIDKRAVVINVTKDLNGDIWELKIEGKPVGTQFVYRKTIDVTLDKYHANIPVIVRSGSCDCWCPGVIQHVPDDFSIIVRYKLPDDEIKTKTLKNTQIYDWWGIDGKKVGIHPRDNQILEDDHDWLIAEMVVSMKDDAPSKGSDSIIGSRIVINSGSYSGRRGVVIKKDLDCNQNHWELQMEPDGQQLFVDISNIKIEWRRYKRDMAVIVYSEPHECWCPGIIAEVPDDNRITVHYKVPNNKKYPENMKEITFNNTEINTKWKIWWENFGLHPRKWLGKAISYSPVPDK